VAGALGRRRRHRAHQSLRAQAYLDGLADIHRGEYVDPRKSTEAFATVAEEWFSTTQHRQPKSVGGYRSLLDTVVLPR
jgi:hypothetical protein